MLIAPGTRFGTYQVRSLLGAGGLGEVYLAHDPKLGRDVALKVLRASSANQRARLEREARAVAALNHPNIVTIYAVDEVDDMPYLVMELVDGHPLHKLIPTTGMTLRELLELAIPAAEALAAAHRKGIIHRDLKPANIMVTRDRRVKLLDFGLAKAIGPNPIELAETLEQTGAGVMVGTLAYMSPEQARGEVLDGRSDIFSFGVVLFEMASGRRPFDGPTGAAALDAVLHRPAPPIASFTRMGAPELDAIVVRSLAKKPSGRYGKVEDLLADLRALESGSKSGQVVISAPTSGPSVAVLPFANLSSDPDQEYFCDGMAEELITALTKIKGLSVSARSTAFQLKGQGLDVRQVGERLGVQSVLEGSVRKAGNRLRITAQLVNVSDGFPLWGERYDVAADDIFAIQDEIARAITENLEVRLARRNDSAIVKQATTNLEAYDAYLRGRFFQNRLIDIFESLTKARRFFERAVELDPSFALAWAALAEACNSLGYFAFLSSAEASRDAMYAAENAVRLNPGLAEGHAALGWTKTLFAIDLATAEQDFQRALELSPNYSFAHGYYSILLNARGRFTEALAHAERARELDPFWMHVPFIISTILLAAGQAGRAEQMMRSIIDSDPAIPGAYWYLSLALMEQERFDEGIAALESALPMVHRTPLFLAVLGLLYGKAGRLDDARAIARELDEAPVRPPWTLAVVHGGLGDFDAAFAHLDDAIEQRNDQIFLMGVDPRFKPLRQDPRFDQTLRRLGLPLPSGTA